MSTCALTCRQQQSSDKQAAAWWQARVVQSAAAAPGGGGTHAVGCALPQQSQQAARLQHAATYPPGEVSSGFVSKACVSRTTLRPARAGAAGAMPLA